LLSLLSLTSGFANAQQASKQYKKLPRDPFVKYRPPVKLPPAPKPSAIPITTPPIQDRIDRYKALKASAMSIQQPAPKPTTALLISELDVIGIFRTPRGYAAMVEAKPIRLSYVIYPGEQLYDGQLVAVEESRLVFRHELKWSNGKVDKTIQMKALRQPNAVIDSMAATRSQAPAEATTVPVSTSSTPSNTVASPTANTAQQSNSTQTTQGNK
jgi:hypothetical protein